MPVASVANAAGVYGIIPLEQLLAERKTRRAPGGGYSRGNYTFKSGGFATVEHGAEEVIDDNEAKMYSDYFDAETIAAARAYSAVLRNAEKRAADTVFNTGTFANSAAGTAWSSPGSATPLTDVESAVISIYDTCGLWANTLIMNYKVFRLLRNCQEIIDRINSAGAGSPSKASDVTVQMLKEVFAIDRLIVAGATRNSAAEDQTATPEQIWTGANVMVCRTSTSTDFKDPCIGRTMHWSEDGSQVGGTVETYRDETVRGDVVRVRHQVEEKILYPEAGHLLTGIGG